MSSSQKPLPDSQPLAKQGGDDVTLDHSADGQQPKTAPQGRSTVWRLMKMYADRGFWKFRRIRKSHILTMVGLCCIFWVLGKKLLPESQNFGPGLGEHSTEEFTVEVNLGSPESGGGASDIAQVEFLDEETRQPDPAFLPIDYDAEYSDSVSEHASPAGLHETLGDRQNPAWLLGTIEADPQPTQDTSRQ